MSSITNLEAAKELVKKYRSITKKDLDREYYGDDPCYYALTSLTGFGKESTCPLCRDTKCENCIHSIKLKISGACTYDSSYDKIEFANNIDELYQAIQERANYLEELIKEIEECTEQ